MNELTIFENNEFGKIRVQKVDNEAWFCLKDVCDILEIEQASKVKSRLNEKGVTTIPTLTNGGNQELIYINESNLYKVIFQSRKESAERFTDWVTSEVLPSVRKHGVYLTSDKIEEVLSNPDTIIKLAMDLKEERNQRQLLQQNIDSNKPKILFAESVETSETSILIGELAKIIKQSGHDVGQNRLFEWLREKSYLISRKGSDYNMPTQKSMELKLFEIKERTMINPDGSTRITKTAKVTGKGQIYFINKFKVCEECG